MYLDIPSCSQDNGAIMLHHVYLCFQDASAGLVAAAMISIVPGKRKF